MTVLLLSCRALQLKTSRSSTLPGRDVDRSAGLQACITGRAKALRYVCRTCRSQYAAAVRRAVSGVDPKLPIARVRTMDDVARGAVAQQRFNMT